MDKLLTARDIQEVFSCSRPMAYKLIHSPGFPSITIENRFYVEESELRAWLKAHRGKAYTL